MATITLKNVPDDLHQRLKESAARNRRSMNQEAISLLRMAFMSPRKSAEELTAGLAAVRASFSRPYSLTIDEIQKAIDDPHS